MFTFSYSFLSPSILFFLRRFNIPSLVSLPRLCHPLPLDVTRGLNSADLHHPSLTRLVLGNSRETVLLLRVYIQERLLAVVAEPWHNATPGFQVTQCGVCFMPQCCKHTAHGIPLLTNWLGPNIQQVWQCYEKHRKQIHTDITGGHITTHEVYYNGITLITYVTVTVQLRFLLCDCRTPKTLLVFILSLG